jgi:uncharacterized protein (TIGR00369 family)
MPQRLGPHDVRPEDGARLDQGQRHERQPRPERPDRPERTDRPERPDQPQRPERRRSYRWEDPAPSGAAARTMAGADFFGAIADGTLPPPPIASTLGFTLVWLEPGRAVFEFTPSEFHYNPIGSVHGGVCATMCDSACGCAVHSMLPAGTYYTSQDLSVKFLRAITTSTGPLRCEGTVIHLGSRTALAQASLTDGTGRQYAHATSSCLIFRP